MSAPSIPVNPDAPSAPSGYFPPPPGYYTPASAPISAPTPGLPFGYAAPATRPIGPAYTGAYTGPIPATPAQPGILGPKPAPGSATPSNALQGMLLRNLSFGAAVSPYVMALIGAVVALVSGLLLTLAAQALWSAAFQAVFSAAGSPLSALQTPDLIKLFMIEQHVPLAVSTASGDTSGVSLTATLNLPLTGLLLFPAIALTIGGYVSAASDYSRQPRYSILRGALIGPIYAVAMLIMAATSASTTQISTLGATVNLTISADPLWAFLYGLLWGALFGALGGWLQLAGRRGVSAALATVRHSARPEVYGAVTGAIAAFALGALGFMALVIAAGAMGIVSQQSTIYPNPLLSLLTKGASGSALVIFSTVALAPTAATLLLALSTGASLTATQTNGVPVTYSYTTLGTQLHYPVWYYAFLLIPFIALLIGGRVSARAAGATGAGRALVSGALMSLPFSVLLTLMAALGGFNIQITGLGSAVSLSMAIAILPAFFIALLAAAVVGALGGLSEVALPWLGALPRWLLIPLRPLSFLLNPLLDLITGSPGGARRSLSRLYFYDGVLLSICLALVGAGLDFLNAAPNPALPFQSLVRLDELAAALLAGLPLLYFAGSAITALSAPLYDTELAPAQAAGAFAAAVAPFASAQPGMAYTYPPVYSQPLTGPVGYQTSPSMPVIQAMPGYIPGQTAPAMPAMPMIPGMPAYAPILSTPRPPVMSQPVIPSYPPITPIPPLAGASAPSLPSLTSGDVETGSGESGAASVEMGDQPPNAQPMLIVEPGAPAATEPEGAP